MTKWEECVGRMINAIRNGDAKTKPPKIALRVAIERAVKVANMIYGGKDEKEQIYSNADQERSIGGKVSSKDKAGTKPS